MLASASEQWRFQPHIADGCGLQLVFLLTSSLDDLLHGYRAAEPLGWVLATSRAEDSLFSGEAVEVITDQI